MLIQRMCKKKKKKKKNVYYSSGQMEGRGGESVRKMILQGEGGLVLDDQEKLGKAWHRSISISQLLPQPPPILRSNPTFSSDWEGQKILDPNPLLQLCGLCNWAKGKSYWLTSSETSKYVGHEEDLRGPGISLFSLRRLAGPGQRGRCMREGGAQRRGLKEMRKRGSFRKQKCFKRRCRGHTCGTTCQAAWTGSPSLTQDGGSQTRCPVPNSTCMSLSKYQSTVQFWINCLNFRTKRDLNFPQNPVNPLQIRQVR